MGVTVSALAHAWAMLPEATRLLGDSSVDDLASFRFAAESMAREQGFEGEFVEISGELVSEGVPETHARCAAFWAARRFYGVDPRAARELDGPSDDELAAQQLEAEADAAEREANRLLAERGWAEPVAQPAPPAAPAPVVLDRLCEWPEQAIRRDVDRFMSASERKLFRSELERAKPVAPDSLTAARYAMQRVIDRRAAGGAAA